VNELQKICAEGHRQEIERMRLVIELTQGDRPTVRFRANGEDVTSAEIAIIEAHIAEREAIIKTSD
jgi:hypothetical protein